MKIERRKEKDHTEETLNKHILKVKRTDEGITDRFGNVTSIRLQIGYVIKNRGKKVKGYDVRTEVRMNTTDRRTDKPK